MSNFINQILQSEKTLAFPIMTHPGIEALGKTVREAVSDGEIHYQAIKYISEHFDTIACTSIMDLTVEAEAFGAIINLPEHEVPSVTGRLVNDLKSVGSLEVPTLDKGRIPQYLLANKLAAENIRSKPVFSGCIGPFSLAGRLYDMSEILMDIYIEPDVVNQLLEKCTEFLVNYCRALKATGTTGVIIAEPAAGLLSDDDCMMYSTVFVKQIVDAVQDDNFTVILHNCGNTGHCTNAMIASGARALHFGNAINMEDVLKQCPENVVVIGNLNPVGVFKQGTESSVRKATQKLMTETAGYKNFVISSGCDLPPFVPEENIRVFLETVKSNNV
ncbi:MAG TPA: uroporphyrinogen decarboxylase family protein [Paludibacter sp.]|nr:uroporphyrinogen decarboxylase family protein [Paludibacter sp.]